MSRKPGDFVAPDCRNNCWHSHPARPLYRTFAEKYRLGLVSRADYRAALRRAEGTYAPSLPSRS